MRQRITCENLMHQKKILQYLNQISNAIDVYLAYILSV